MQQQQPVPEVHELAEQPDHRCMQQTLESVNQAEDSSPSPSLLTDAASPAGSTAAATAAAFEQQQLLLGDNELMEGIRAYLYYGMGFSDDEEDAGNSAELCIGSDELDTPEGEWAATGSCSRSMPVTQQQQQYLSVARSSDSQGRDSETGSGSDSDNDLQWVSSDDDDPLLLELHHHHHQQQQQQGSDELDDYLLQLLPSLPQVPLPPPQQRQGPTPMPVPAAAIQATQALLAGLTLHVQAQQAEAQQQHHNQPQPQQSRSNGTSDRNAAHDTIAEHMTSTNELLQHFSNDDGQPLLQLLKQHQQQRRQGMDDHDGSVSEPPLQQQQQGPASMPEPAPAVQATQALSAGLAVHVQAQQAEAQQQELQQERY